MTHEPFSFDEYQEFTYETAIYPGADKTRNGGSTHGLVYVAMGLAGEAGEISNDVKKILRDDGEIITEERRLSLMGELGDVFYYWVRNCMEIGVTPEYIAKMNMEKLRNRKVMGTIRGSGSSR